MIVEDVHISFKDTIDVVGDLIKSSTPTLEEIPIYEESISDIQDALVESSTPVPDDMMFQRMILVILSMY